MPIAEEGKKKSYVTHPRYGDKPMKSGIKYDAEEIVNAFWGYNSGFFFPESAIPANLSKQNYSIYPRKIYVDLEKKCITCNRLFIFYAKEQQYWYETLGFYIDADCVKCTDCRKKEQEIKLLMREYEELHKKENKNKEEISKLKNTALELYQLGYIRNKQKVDNIG